MWSWASLGIGAKSGQSCWPPPRIATNWKTVTTSGGAQRTLLDLHSRGIVVNKVDVRIDDLIAWCDHERLPLGAATRAKYAVIKLQREHATQKEE